MDLLKKLTNFKLKILIKLKLFISIKMSIINLYLNKSKYRILILYFNKSEPC